MVIFVKGMWKVPVPVPTLIHCSDYLSLQAVHRLKKIWPHTRDSCYTCADQPPKQVMTEEGLCFHSGEVAHCTELIRPRYKTATYSEVSCLLIKEFPKNPFVLVLPWLQTHNTSIASINYILVLSVP